MPLGRINTMNKGANNHLELLCERCGYCVEGLPAGAKCPECARPVADSMPHARPGSPWQIDPGAASWLATNWETLSRPAATMRTIRVDTRSSWRLLVINCLAAAAPYGALAALFMLIHILLTEGPLWEEKADLARFAIGALYVFASLFGVWAAHWIPLLTLSLPFVAVLRGIGLLRRWRITWAVAITIAAHSSAAAFLMPLMFVTGIALCFLTAVVLGEIGLYLDSFIAMLGAGVIVAFPTLLVLTLLLRTGLRECRFANAPRPYDSPP